MYPAVEKDWSNHYTVYCDTSLDVIQQPEYNNLNTNTSQCINLIVIVHVPHHDILPNLLINKGKSLL